MLLSDAPESRTSIGRSVATIVLSFASAGASLLIASFLLSYVGNQRAAAVTFMGSAFLLALFGVPGLRIGFARAREDEVRRVIDHVERHGAILYERYVALTKPSALEADGPANWRREVERLRRSMAKRPRHIDPETFHELVTTHVAAMRQRALAWGKPPAPPAARPLQQEIAHGLIALGWRAAVESAPGLLGPVVVASRAGVRVVLRCEKAALSAERVARAIQARQIYRADFAAIVCAGPVEHAAKLSADRAGVVLLPPGRLRAIYPRASAIWSARRDKRHAMEAGVRARAQTSGR